MNPFNPINGKDGQYDKLLKEVREFYDNEVKSGESVKLTIKANNGKLSGFEIIRNRQA